MRKLTHGVEWFIQGHAHASSVQEHVPFKFQHLYSLHDSALNPSMGIWKKKKKKPLLHHPSDEYFMGSWKLFLACLVLVLVFFSPSPSWSYFPVSFHSLPSGTDMFLSLPLRSSQPKESLSILKIPDCSFQSWSQPWQVPTPGNQEPEAMGWPSRRAESQLHF